MQMTQMREVIEYANLLNIAGEVLIFCGDRKKAATLLSESRLTARSKNLMSEEITATILESRIFSEEGNYEKAFGSYKNALQLCKQSVMTISSEKDKVSFMEKPKMIFLANQIRDLNKKIGSKQKAGV
jgi:hypothetical protein